MSDRSLIVLSPDLQFSFYNQLKIISEQYLSKALTDTILKMDIERIDGELLQLVSKDKIRKVAGWGLRGERIFPIPCILVANPFLLGYYRLLFGFSQKQFYQSNIFGKFGIFSSHGMSFYTLIMKLFLIVYDRLYGTLQFRVVSAYLSLIL
ncbi:hypothetical protein Mhun_2538 [Methanospirillum hungatei JF-1]|uniref:Uncharacterized protein n=1 Tax=Methanospirillum hungatei JF-1 (strain ATCC 27890 / DSM 864 / NBRC 100397 / JF-1) TaxID=323259 RepID=Q2FSI1_METHJ|nr:XcyI family restriction endonuclease [Methanospirillum hungatei]ABD42237.1 hypothetical protein Mhun_2538 [Methanospirillum hungatei JF-1]